MSNGRDRSAEQRVARAQARNGVRIADIEGGANAGAIFYNFECPTERTTCPTR